MGARAHPKSQVEKLGSLARVGYASDVLPPSHAIQKEVKSVTMENDGQELQLSAMFSFRLAIRSNRTPMQKVVFVVHGY